MTITATILLRVSTCSRRIGKGLLCLCLLAGGLVGVPAYADISTFAGSGNTVGSGSGISHPVGVAVDSTGNVYVVEENNHRIMRIASGSDVASVFAGTGVSGYSGDGGQAALAQFSYPVDITVDSSDNLYIADRGNHCIRYIDVTTGVISTYAGSGTSGFAGDGGPASAAQLSYPVGVTLDSAGNLLIADRNNQRIRRVDAGTLNITTVAGTGVAGYSGDGGLATAAQLSFPVATAVDSADNIYIADSGSNRVRRIDNGTGIITTVAGTGASGAGGDGGPATAATVYRPGGLAVDTSGNLLILQSENHVIRRVDAATGDITSLAGIGVAGYGGDGGPAAAALLNAPTDMVLDGSDKLYIADSNNNSIRVVDSVAGAGVITSLTNTGGLSFAGDGGAATAARLYHPNGVAVDSTGNVYIADTANHRIRLVDAASGTISTVAGNGAMGFSGDGGAAIDASLSFPSAIALDSAANLYITDTGNNRVRRVDAASSVITTVAGGGSVYPTDGVAATTAKLGFPRAVIVDGSDNLIIADSGHQTIRYVDMGTGLITTLAGIPATGTDARDSSGFGGDGGPATAATLQFPTGLLLDASGNLYIADTGNNRVRRVDTSGAIATIAGGASSTGGSARGFGGDGDLATNASLYSPSGLAFAATSGDLYIADSGNNRIRRIDGTTGIIKTIAGNGLAGFAGDGGSALDASLYSPAGLALQANGNLLVADPGNERIRLISQPFTTANNAPSPVADSYTTAEDVTVTTGNVLANDSDPDGDTVTLVSADARSVHGGYVVNNNDGTFTFTPSSGFQGTDSFEYVVQDPSGAQASATVSIQVGSTNNGGGAFGAGLLLVLLACFIIMPWRHRGMM